MCVLPWTACDALSAAAAAEREANIAQAALQEAQKVAAERAALQASLEDVSEGGGESEAGVSRTVLDHCPMTHNSSLMMLEIP